MAAKVTWSHKEKPVLCNSLAEIDAVLDRAHLASSPERPALAVVTNRGYGICIGLGIDPTVIEIHYPSDDVEFYTSSGIEMARDLVDFFGHEGHFQYSRNSFVPLEDAREALRHFIEKQYLSRSFRWRNVRGELTTPGER
jgi:hypothetical protein